MAGSYLHGSILSQLVDALLELLLVCCESLTLCLWVAPFSENETETVYTEKNQLRGKCPKSLKYLSLLYGKYLHGHGILIWIYFIMCEEWDYVELNDSAYPTLGVYFAITLYNIHYSETFALKYWFNPFQNLPCVTWDNPRIAVNTHKVGYTNLWKVHKTW